jgi:hypothetical protein
MSASSRPCPLCHPSALSHSIGIGIIIISIVRCGTYAMRSILPCIPLALYIAESMSWQLPETE